MQDMVRTQIRVEYFYDHETRRWDYVVPQLRIVGGGGPTRAEAAERAAAAIAFALADNRDEQPADPDVGYIPVAVG